METSTQRAIEPPPREVPDALYERAYHDPVLYQALCIFERSAGPDYSYVAFLEALVIFYSKMREELMKDLIKAVNSQSQRVLILKDNEG